MTHYANHILWCLLHTQWAKKRNFSLLKIEKMIYLCSIFVHYVSTFYWPMHFHIEEVSEK